MERINQYISLINDLERFGFHVDKISAEFRTLRAVSFVEMEDDKRLSDIQQALDLAHEMLRLEGQILLCRLTEEGRKKYEATRDFHIVVEETKEKLADENGELKNWR